MSPCPGAVRAGQRTSAGATGAGAAPGRTWGHLESIIGGLSWDNCLPSFHTEAALAIAPPAVQGSQYHRHGNQVEERICKFREASIHRYGKLREEENLQVPLERESF